MIFTVTVLLIRVAWWLLVAWFRLFVAIGQCAARLFRRARTRRQLRHGLRTARDLLEDLAPRRVR